MHLFHSLKKLSHPSQATSPSIPPPTLQFSTSSTKPEILPDLSLKLKFSFGSKVDLDALLCLETSMSQALGVGFSIAYTPEEIPRNQKDVAKHLYIVIKKFIKLNASLKDPPIYLTGESYAGKYVPAIGYHVLKKNAQLPVHSKVINLVGVVIGNRLTDPVSHVDTHAASAYYFGLINDKQRSQLESLQRKVLELMHSQGYYP